MKFAAYVCPIYSTLLFIYYNYPSNEKVTDASSQFKVPSSKLKDWYAYGYEGKKTGTVPRRGGVKAESLK